MLYCYLYVSLRRKAAQYKNPERRKADFCLYLLMENNQNTTPNRPKRKQLAPRDMIIVALIVLVMTRVNWANMNSFHVLILFMLFLMLMLRWGNMRKEAVRKQAMERYKEQFEAEAAKKAAEQAAAEPAAAEDITVDGEAVPAEEPSAPAEDAVEEKTEV